MHRGLLDDLKKGAGTVRISVFGRAVTGKRRPRVEELGVCLGRKPKLTSRAEALRTGP
jgi:hypothetical protein